MRKGWPLLGAQIMEGANWEQDLLACMAVEASHLFIHNMTLHAYWICIRNFFGVVCFSLCSSNC